MYFQLQSTSCNVGFIKKTVFFPGKGISSLMDATKDR